MLIMMCWGARATYCRLNDMLARRPIRGPSSSARLVIAPSLLIVGAYSCGQHRKVCVRWRTVYPAAPPRFLLSPSYLSADNKDAFVRIPPLFTGPGELAEKSVCMWLWWQGGTGGQGGSSGVYVCVLNSDNRKGRWQSLHTRTTFFYSPPPPFPASLCLVVLGYCW